MLAHFEAPEHTPNAQANQVFAAQRIPQAASGSGNLFQFLFGSQKQLITLSGALLGQHRIEAGYQSLPRIIRMPDLGQVCRVEQR
jgi:hypothetical protein